MGKKKDRKKQRYKRRYSKVRSEYNILRENLIDDDIPYDLWINKTPRYLRGKEMDIESIKFEEKKLRNYLKKDALEMTKILSTPVPKAFKENYIESMKRANEFKQDLKRENKFEMPDNPKLMTLENIQKVINSASGNLIVKRQEQYKANYLQAVKEQLGGTEKGWNLYHLIEKIPASKMITVLYNRGDEDLRIENVYAGDEEIISALAESTHDRWVDYTGIGDKIG